MPAPSVGLTFLLTFSLLLDTHNQIEKSIQNEKKIIVILKVVKITLNLAMC